MNKRLTIIALMLLSLISTRAQDTPSSSTQTTSPYSRYGLGVLSDKGIGASRGMGGISYGIRGQNVNPGNPASYSSVDSLTFIFDIGISYTNAKLSEPGASQRDDNGGLDFLAIQFPISKRLGISAGFLPYSAIGYSFGNIESIGTGEAEYQNYFSGSGGLNQIYGGLAYEPFNGLSLGANVAYLYGTITRERSIPIIGSSSSGAVTSLETRKLTVNAAKFDFGVQYQIPLSQKRTLTLGAVYSPQIKPSSRIEGIHYDSTGDTLTYLPRKSAGVQLPHTFGLGFSVSSRSLLFGADVTFQKWKDMGYPAEMNDSLSVSDRFNNRWRFNAGIEYVPNPNDRSFFKRMRYRGGINYSNSYLNAINSSDKRLGGYNEYGATLGLGIPLRDAFSGRTSFINIAFEYTRISPEISSMIKEEYFGVSLNVNLNDLWFMKNKFK